MSMRAPPCRTRFFSTNKDMLSTAVLKGSAGRPHEFHVGREFNRGREHRAGRGVIGAGFVNRPGDPGWASNRRR